MATAITTDRLRALAETRQTNGKVLSLYVNLDPREFATPPARATEINSVLDSAERAIRDHEDVTHDERVALEADLHAVRERLRGNVDLAGARGLAIFACSSAGLFELLKLPRPVEHEVAIGEAPCIAPLARIGAGDPWWLLLVDRRHARLLAGTVDGVVELWRVDNETSGQHQQGGLSHPRYQRSIEKEADDHLRSTAEEVRKRLARERISGLLVGGPQATTSHFEQMLHADVARCLKGHFDVDVWNSSADDVLAAARPVLDEEVARRDVALIERLHESLGVGGRAAAGLDDVLRAVHERRLEWLIVEDGLTAAGVRCPQCGWMGVTASAACPADGTHTEVVENIVGLAVELAFAQDARVRVLPAEAIELQEHGSIAAITRF